MIRTHDRRLALFGVGLLTAAIACTTLSPNQADLSQPAASTSPASRTEMACERLDYPCSVADADPQALARGGEVMDLAEQTYQGTDSMLAAGQRLAEEEDVVELAYDEHGVWFRVDGATPMWLWDFDEVGPSASSSSSESAASGHLARPISDASGPIGEQPAGREPKKRALLLAPWAFRIGDTSSPIADILGEHRNYQCSTCVVRKDTMQDPREGQPDDDGYYGPSIDRFLGWGSYDLIYVFSHGVQWCGLPDEDTGGYFIEGVARGADECVGMLSTGRFRKSIFDDPSTFDIQGVAWGRKPGEDFWIEALSPDFFISHYGGGLDDAILIFNSCQLFKNARFYTPLIGENTAVLGWTDTVRSSRGEDTAVAFVGELVRNGLRAEKAYENALDSSGYNIENTRAGAELEMEGDQDPRGVEIVTWMHPLYPQELELVGSIPVEGIPGDGEADQMLVRIKVDGIEEGQSPTDFVIHIKVGDRELEQTVKPSEKVGDYSYQVQQLVDLGFDVNGDEDRSLEAWIDLPEGGHTRHYIDESRLASCGWTGSVSGARTGEISGDIALDLNQVAGVDPSKFEELGALGALQSIPDMPAPGGGQGTPRTVMLTGQEVFPAVTASSNGLTTALFSRTELAGLTQEELQSALQFSEDTDEYIEGSVSASLTYFPSQQPMSLSAHFVWNAGSHCDLDMILEAAKQGGPAEGGN